MAEINVERVGQLERALLEILSKAPEGLPAREALEALERALPPTSFESGEYKNGARRYEKIVRFHTIPLVKAGWLVKADGVWHATDEGRRALGQFRDPAEFQRTARRLYHSWKKDRPPVAEDDSVAVDEEPQGLALVSIEEAEEQARGAISDHLASMNPYDLQKLVAGLLRAMGYYVSWIAPKGPDDGVDIIAGNDPLGTKSPRIKVQVKRRADRVDLDELKSFLANISSHDVGIYVSLGGFTSSAAEASRRQESRLVTLVDGQALVQLWIDNYGKLAEEDRTLLPLRAVHYLAPSD